MCAFFNNKTMSRTAILLVVFLSAACCSPADEVSKWNDPASVLGELNSRRLVAGRWDISNQLSVSAAVQGPSYPEQGLVQYGFKKAGKIALLAPVAALANAPAYQSWPLFHVVDAADGKACFLPWAEKTVTYAIFPKASCKIIVTGPLQGCQIYVAESSTNLLMIHTNFNNGKSVDEDVVQKDKAAKAVFTLAGAGYTAIGRLARTDNPNGWGMVVCAVTGSTTCKSEFVEPLLPTVAVTRTLGAWNTGLYFFKQRLAKFSAKLRRDLRKLDRVLADQ